MAKVIITLSDNPVTGNVTITQEYEKTFNPDFPTAAEYLAMQFIMQSDDAAKQAGS
jgi:purine-nucleoside phosphorylase